MSSPGKMLIAAPRKMSRFALVYPPNPSHLCIEVDWCSRCQSHPKILKKPTAFPVTTPISTERRAKSSISQLHFYPTKKPSRSPTKTDPTKNWKPFVEHPVSYNENRKPAPRKNPILPTLNQPSYEKLIHHPAAKPRKTNRSNSEQPPTTASTWQNVLTSTRLTSGGRFLLLEGGVILDLRWGIREKRIILPTCQHPNNVPPPHSYFLPNFVVCFSPMVFVQLMRRNALFP